MNYNKKELRVILMIKMKQDGFSLIELLIVIAIIGILATVAYPSYQESMRKSNRTDGQSALLEAISRMERYFYTNNTYTNDLTELGYSAASNVTTQDGHYEISVSSATTSCPLVSCVALEAKAVRSQVADGNLTLNTLGQKLPAKKW